jgi:hypothetical protein
MAYHTGGSSVYQQNMISRRCPRFRLEFKLCFYLQVYLPYTVANLVISRANEVAHLVTSKSTNWAMPVLAEFYNYTSSTAQGGGGSFKNRKPIGKIGCCELGTAERIHWRTERCLRSPLFHSLSLIISFSLSFSDYLLIYFPFLF